MKTKLFTIAMTAALMLTAMTKVQAQNYEGPCLPSMHGLDDHQSAFCGFTQTIELAEGWNWFSTYVELDDPIELLNMLEDGMGDSGVQIENVIDGVNMNIGDGYWAGDLDGTGLMNEHMYMIEVSEDITVELQGPATNPESHEITLYPGDFSWIGFPCAEEVDVNVALAGLEPEEGDYIENNELGIIYYYGEWMGDFNTMIPGRGYMYFSNSTQQKTLIFLTTSKGKSVSLRKHRE